MKIAIILIGMLFFILLVGSGLFLIAERRSEQNSPIVPIPTPSPQVTEAAGIKTYSIDRFGFNFEFPAHYFLEEKELGNAHRYHRQISLTEDTEESRLVREGKATPPQEGPPAITIDFYQNNLDTVSLLQWVTHSAASNYKLGDGSHATATIAEKEGIAYTWSGLYKGETQVFEHNGNIIAVSVTYLHKEDKIREDFLNLIKAIKLVPPAH